MQLCKLFRLVLANILNSSLLNCLPYVLKTCSRTSGPCLLTCSRANVPCVLTCSRDNVHCMFQRLRANMSCVLTCSTVNVSFILTCSGANVPCVLAFQRALHTHVLMCLTCPRAQVPTYLQQCEFMNVKFSQQREFIYNPNLVIMCRLKKRKHQSGVVFRRVKIVWRKNPGKCTFYFGIKVIPRL